MEIPVVQQLICICPRFLGVGFPSFLVLRRFYWEDLRSPKTKNIFTLKRSGTARADSPGLGCQISWVLDQAFFSLC